MKSDAPLAPKPGSLEAYIAEGESLRQAEGDRRVGACVRELGVRGYMAVSDEIGRQIDEKLKPLIEKLRRSA